MKTAVAQVYDILNESDLMKDVDIYTNSVAESALVKPILPIARIVELQGQYDSYSSNNPFAIVFYIQLDMWVDTLQDVDKYYFSLDTLMRENNWECTYTEQTDDVDLPNSKRIIKRYVATIQLDFN